MNQLCRKSSPKQMHLCLADSRTAGDNASQGNRQSNHIQVISVPFHFWYHALRNDLSLFNERALVTSLELNSARTPIHLILITDLESVGIILNVMTGGKVPFYHKGTLVGVSERKRLRHVAFSIDFVNVDVLRGRVESMARPMKVGPGIS